MSRRTPRWRPGLDPRAVFHPPPAPHPAPYGRAPGERHVVVVGGGIAGMTAVLGLAERGVGVTLLERGDRLGGRVAAWPVTLPDGSTSVMSRGFHAFFRQYYNLRAVLRRTDPTLERLRALEDYPLVRAGGSADSFAGIPRTPPWNLAAFVARSPSFDLDGLRSVDVEQALGLLDLRFPGSFTELDGVSAAAVLDRLRFPDEARHLALEVFARSFFADPREFSGAELLAMFHLYFVGSSEGLLFDVPRDDYDATLWAPLGAHLHGLGVRTHVGRTVTSVDDDPSGGLVVRHRGADPGGCDELLDADAVVLALDPVGLREVVASSPRLGDRGWREQVAGVRSAPRFAVWRLWLDGLVRPDRPPFLGTSGHGPLDNVSVLERFEDHAARWSAAHAGSVVELHAYAVPDGTAEDDLRAALLSALHTVYPETTGLHAVHDEWLVRADCVLVGTEHWAARPGVATPDPRVVLAGDAVRCDLPVALMERAATTGWLAADRLLTAWGLPGHGVWSVPLGSRLGPVPSVARRGIRLYRKAVGAVTRR
ncbi:FAD-dependent oxidoreductase [Phycicoccus sp. HDW14]|uniref:FAD-dependent oxidoreductase n=1 Tax=Phycicoccus sp. HDW14 TaxID=2714941 RepID=UPI001409D1D6|nr:FAD-dependent oxidoreductase [Phycicoccus sp. HDW14]QIM22760.1 FAD-dependent oxidoreductase [Phycicoccus sp. HDW14]